MDDGDKIEDKIEPEARVITEEGKKLKISVLYKEYGVMFIFGGNQLELVSKADYYKKIGRVYIPSEDYKRMEYSARKKGREYLKTRKEAKQPFLPFPWLKRRLP